MSAIPRASVAHAFLSLLFIVAVGRTAAAQTPQHPLDPLTADEHHAWYGFELRPFDFFDATARWI